MQILDTYYCTYDDGTAEWFIGQTYKLPYLTREYRKVIVPADGSVLYNTQEQSYSLCQWIQNDSEISNWVELDSTNGNLTFTSTAAATVALTLVGSPQQPTIKYSYNNRDWQTYSIGTTLSIAANGYVFFKNESYFLSQDESNYFLFVTTGNILLSGDIASMINGQHLNYYCFYKLFAGTTITNTPNLSYTELGAHCYDSMFYGCTSLTSATLPATSLVEGCYKEMFKNASSFNDLTVSFSQWLDSDNATTDWLSGAAVTGTLTHPSELPTTQRDDSHIPVGWNVEVDYFYLLTTNTNIVTLTQNGTVSATLEYSLDKTTWQSVTYGNGISFTDKIYFRGDNATFSTSTSNYISINATQNYTANGNIMTLKDSSGMSTTASSYDFCGLFDGSTTLTSATDLELPATTLAEGCYSYLFSGCSSLTGAPDLDAMNLADSCYAYMFYGCSALVNAPALPATVMKDGCYSNMFYGCLSLVTAPTLNGTSLANNCYGAMFAACSALVNAPTLNATPLVESCYYNMFNGCSALVNAPALPATTLETFCYAGMFNGCSSLTNAPALPATTLASGCYMSMFNGCSALTLLSVYADNISAAMCISNWLANTASGTNGTLYSYGTATFTSGSEIPSNWSVYVDSTNYLYLENEYSGANAATLTKTGSPTATLEYSLNKLTWQSVTYGTAISFTDKLYLRGNNASFSTSTSDYISIDATQNYSVSGNIMSLKDKTAVSTTVTAYDFISLFMDSTSLISAENLLLPAGTLAQACYSGMFDGCSNLEDAPDLNAMNLADNCYINMFSGCSSLTTAPTLPATTVKTWCYAYMFYGCSSLTAAPALNATSVEDNCYNSMFYNCSNMQTAPALNAGTLAAECYYEMFKGCTLLTSLTVACNDITATDCIDGWLDDTAVGTTGTLYANGTATFTSGQEIPSNWSVYVDSTNYLYLENEYSSDNEVTITKNGSLTATLEYSLNKLTWQTVTYGTAIQFSDKLYLRGDNATFSTSSSRYITISTSQNYSVGGNIMSLKDKTAVSTSVSNYDFGYLFKNSTKLISVADLDLPSSQLANYCFILMFMGCSNLADTPTLASTLLAQGCYEQMFRDCISLTTAPALPSTTLANYCYAAMFNDCTSLTTAPTLNAPTLVYYCYQQMFKGCSLLTQLTVAADDISATSCIDGWLDDTAVGTTGTLYSNGTATFVSGQEIPSNWSVYGDVNYFYLKNEYSGSNAATLSKTGFPTATLEYSLDKTTWQSVTFDTAISFTDKLYLKGDNGTFSTSTSNYISIDATQNYSVGGNIMTLKDSSGVSTTLASYDFISLFMYCHTLISATNLELPADTLSDHCYNWMFYDCNQLATAPALPATHLASDCYSGMFNGCSSLATTPALPADTLADYCYYSMFNGCTSLITGPTLPANILTILCYRSMFADCSNLTLLTVYANNISASRCLSGWLTDTAVGTTGTLHSLGTATFTVGTDVPSNWTVVTT